MNTREGTVNATEPLPALAAMVRHRHDQGRSYRDMSEAARKAGKTISHAQLQAYATNIVRKAPSTDQLEALAAALDTTLEKVRVAMIQQYYGYVPRSVAPDDAGTSELFAAVPPDLSPDEERELARLVTAWVSTRQNGG